MKREFLKTFIRKCTGRRTQVWSEHGGDGVVETAFGQPSSFYFYFVIIIIPPVFSAFLYVTQTQLYELLGGQDLLSHSVSTTSDACCNFTFNAIATTQTPPCSIHTALLYQLVYTRVVVVVQATQPRPLPPPRAPPPSAGQRLGVVRVEGEGVCLSSTSCFHYKQAPQQSCCSAADGISASVYDPSIVMCLSNSCQYSRKKSVQVRYPASVLFAWRLIGNISN